MRILKWFGLALVSLILLVIIINLAMPKAQSDRLDAIAQAQDMVQASLKDPGSAQFSNVVAYTHPGGMITVCGKVNARNGFGAYGGVQGFIVERPGAAPILEEVSPSIFADFVIRLCNELPLDFASDIPVSSRASGSAR